MAERVEMSMASPRVRSFVAVAAAMLAVVGCASGPGQNAATTMSVPATTATMSLPATSATATPSFATPSPGVVSTSTPMASGSGIDPAASNLSLPPAASVPTVTMVDAEHGVAVVGLSPLAYGNAPSTLWISSDMIHWRDVTPPGAHAFAWETVYATFDQASFLNSSTGWVTAWNAGDDALTAYRTTDSGGTWSAIGIGGHGDHAGDADWIQLLSPRVVLSEAVAATAPGMNLAITIDAGQSWRTTYTGPSPSTTNSPNPGPFELPMSFISATRGFAATAIPPAEPQVRGGLFATADGGTHWTQLTLPGIDTAACAPPTSISSPCLSTLPTFSDPTHAVLASEVITGTAATIRFDTSSDAGASWQQVGPTIDVPLRYVGADSYYQPDALVATPSARSWWVVSDDGTGLTSQVTTDAGKLWSTVKTPGVLGAPTRLEAIDESRALVETMMTTSDGTTNALYATNDSGRSWRRVF
jgi:photosystem II stability/assembly factor-like uncharacterized protein